MHSKYIAMNQFYCKFLIFNHFYFLQLIGNKLFNLLQNLHICNEVILLPFDTCNKLIPYKHRFAMNAQM